MPLTGWWIGILSVGPFDRRRRSLPRSTARRPFLRVIDSFGKPHDSNERQGSVRLHFCPHRRHVGFCDHREDPAFFLDRLIRNLHLLEFPVESLNRGPWIQDRPTSVLEQISEASCWWFGAFHRR